nr:hypothetical protein [Thermoanaerobaculia bacterium]
MTRLRLGRSISLWALFALLVPGLAGALPPLRGYPNDGRKPLDASFLEAQRGWEFGNQLGQKFGACGSGQCIGGSFCDSCRCYSPTTDISRAFCQCRLADPSCGLGECVGP